MTGRRRHKGRELSRNKRKKEGRRQWATPQVPAVVSAAILVVLALTLG
jgi:hypothetical protein